VIIYFLNCPLSTLNLDKDDLENADKVHFTIIIVTISTAFTVGVSLSKQLDNKLKFQLKQNTNRSKWIHFTRKFKINFIN
jgi:hypothetical protein